MTDQYPSARGVEGVVSVYFSDVPSTEIADIECVLDMDDFGEVAGIEVLGWRQQLPPRAFLDAPRRCGPVRWAYDDEVDALYIHLSKARAQNQRSARAKVALDRDRRVVCLEIPVPPLGRRGTH